MANNPAIVVPKQPVSGWNDYDALLNALVRDLPQHFIPGSVPTAVLNPPTVPYATTSVALTSPWAVQGGTIVGYMKDTNGIVHLKGRVTGGTSGSNVFTLPPGFRPGNVDYYPLAGGGSGTYGFVSAMAYITTAGVVAIFLNGSASDISFGGVSFLAEN